MTKIAKIFLADGFEETEALVPYDILKRGGVDVALVSVMPTEKVTSSHGVTVEAHQLLSQGLGGYDLLMLPGGMPGTLNLAACGALCQELKAAASQGKLIGAICAAPSVLGGLGLLRGRKATCYPGFEEKLLEAEATGESVVEDGNFITAIGAGADFLFGLALLARITDGENAEKVKRQIILR